MSKYPDIVTQDMLDSFAHISDVEIQKDITDTEVEIVKMEREIEAHEILMDTQKGTSQGRMEAFRRDANITGISERRDFIEYLTKILQTRKEIV